MMSDCKGFEEFSARFGAELATAVLESICCRETIKTAEYQVISIDAESLDREEANHRLTGTVKVGARHFMFTINSGNWNGTEIIDWERCSGVSMQPAPLPGPWIYADIKTLGARLKLDGLLPVLSRKACDLMGRCPERK